MQGMIPNIITFDMVLFRVEVLPILCPSEELESLAGLTTSYDPRPTALLTSPSNDDGSWTYDLQTQLLVRGRDQAFRSP